MPDSEALQFTELLPWRLRIATAAVFLAVLIVAIDAVPGGPWNLWGALVYVVGLVTYSMLVNRSVVVRLNEEDVRIRLGWRKVVIPYEQITEVAVGPRTPWWKIGRRRLGDGSTGYLMGGPSVRISTGERAMVVSAEESYRVAGAIEHQRERVITGRAADTEQADR